MNTHITGVLPEEIEHIISLRRKAIAIETPDEIKAGDLLKIIEEKQPFGKDEHVEITTVISDVQFYQPRKSGRIQFVSFHVVEVKFISQ